MNENITISLPSLIHRIGSDKAKQAKAIASQYHCILKRIRRSRNWSINGGAVDVQSFSKQLKKPGSNEFNYLTKKIDTALLEHGDKLESLETKLARLIAQNPNITLGELMEITQCTLPEARAARFNNESW